MEQKVLSLFKSHYSIGRSILTLEKAGESEESGPDSIIDLALKHNLKQVFLVEDGFSGFLEAHNNCNAAGLQLIFGLRLTFCKDLTVKDEESLKSNAKYVIQIKNSAGYKRLIRIFSKAATDGFYYEPRMDFKTLKEYWSEADLQLCVPFYDSFLFNNSLTMGCCIPDFTFATPVFFEEDNELPFDFLVKNRIKEFCGDKHKVIPAKSIFYNLRADFTSWQVLKSISARTSLDCPNLNHANSTEFSVESWTEVNR